MKKEIRNWRNWVLLLLIMFGILCIAYATGEPASDVSMLREVTHVFIYLGLAALSFCLCGLLTHVWTATGKIPFIAKLMEDEYHGEASL